MGAHRGVHVTDPALAGSVRRLDGAGPGRGAPRRSSSTWCSPASTRPTASVGSSRRPSRRTSACRTCRTPPAIEPDMAAGPSASGGSARPATTCSRRRCRSSSSGTQALGEPRYPSLQGDHGARGQGDRHPVAGRPRPRCRRRSAERSRRPTRPRQPDRRRRAAPRRSCGARPDDGAARIVDFLADRRII